MKKLMVFLVCTLVLNLVRISPAMAIEHVVAEDIKAEDIAIDISALACERVDSIENVQIMPCALYLLIGVFLRVRLRKIVIDIQC